MAIEFGCENCGAILRVPAEHAGKQARCPQCQGLNIVQQGVSSPAFDPGFPANPPSQQNYGTGQGSHYPSGALAGRKYQLPHRGGMILALGIMSIVCNILAVPGIMAWILGSSDLKKIDAGVMDPEGRGMTQAGMVMGIVMSILAIIGILMFICYFLFIILVVAGAAGAAGAGGGM